MRRGKPVSKLRRCRIEGLEARTVMCAQHVGGWVADPAAFAAGESWGATPSGSLPLPPDYVPPVEIGSPLLFGPAGAPPEFGANGLPMLNSLPGAPAAVYLDFDGFSGNGYGGQQTHTPYDIDGDPATFNAAEQANITTGWQRMAKMMAPFNLNVTTVVPTVPFSWNVLTNSLNGVGYSWGQFDGFAPSGFNPSGDLVGRTSGVVHEMGHNFGLAHQSTYDLLGNKTAEYSSAIDAQHGVLMGVDYDGVVKKWILGHPSGSPSSLQDDMARIAAKIIPHEGPGGDGYRADDYGNTIATASALPTTGTVQQVSGIIERLADKDFFSFTTAGGPVSLNAVRDGSYSQADLKLEIFTAGGTLIASNDGSENDARLFISPTAGTYYAAVSSHTNYNDVGPYVLSVGSLPAGWTSGDVGAVAVAGTTHFDVGTGTYTVAGSGTAIGGTGDSFQFAYQTLNGDGEIRARITEIGNTNASAKSGVMIRETTATGSKHAYMLATPESGNWLRSRTATGGSSADSPRTDEPFAPIWVRLVRAGNTFTGYTSTDGTNWTLEGTVNIAMTSSVLIGLATTATSSSQLSVAKYTSLTVSGSLGTPPPTVNGLPAPTGLAVTSTTLSSATLSWNDSTGETGYTIERASDGFNFATAGTVAAGVTSFTENNLGNATRVFYRLRANDATGVSVASSVAHGLTRPGAVNSLTVTSWTDTKLILNWRDRTGDAGYRIERSTDGTDFTTIGTVGVNVPSFTDMNLTSGTTYHYRVVTLDGLGDAATTPTVTGSTRIAAVGNFRFGAISSTQVELLWDDVATETGYTIERSTNGVDFTTLTTLAADVTTYVDATVTPLSERYYRISAVNGTTPGLDGATLKAGIPAPTPLPTPWVSQDVGAVSGLGAAGFDAGTFTLISGGTDLENTTDAMHFIHQPLAGDGTLVAHIASSENTDDAAEFGIVMRDGLGNNVRSFAVVASPTNAVRLRYRTAAATNSTTSTAITGPKWLRIVRAGNTFTGSISTDGATWTQLGAPVNITMGTNVLVGLVAVTKDADLLSTTTFDHVAIGSPIPFAVADAYLVDEDVSITAGVPVEQVVSAGAAWKYLDDGSDQDVAWRTVGFNDAAWVSGPGPLGYGDGGLGTTVGFGGDANNKHLTTYFRRSFNLTDAARVNQLRLLLMRDDGAAVYLNGVEIVRDNLAVGATSTTTADTSVDGANETTFFNFTIDVATLPAGTLVEGNNVLAVEVHQQAATSSDLRFDLALEVRRNVTASLLANDLNYTPGTANVELVDPATHGTVTLNPNGTFGYTPAADYFGDDSFTYRIVDAVVPIVAAGSTWKYLDNGSNQGTTWRDVGYNDNAWTSGPAELGYGDGGEATVINCGPSAGCNANNFATTYFRKMITLPAGVSARDLTIRVKRDDAAAVYLNGVEVYRDTTLPANALYNVFSNPALPAAEENTFVPIPLPTRMLHSGPNVIAVEVHQAAANSSDVSFDLDLTGRYVSAPATVSLTIRPTDDPPAAVNDAYAVDQGNTLSPPTATGVLANDANPDQEPLQTVLKSPPTNGALTLNADGSFTYTPTVGFSGADAFTYAVTDGVTTTVLPRGSTWKYLDDGSNQGVAWRAAAFDDATWAAGPAQLGYGEGDEATRVRCGPVAACNAQNFATTYFRKSFTVADGAALDQLSLRLVRDDAAAVYLNGVEVYRDTTLPANAAFNVFSNPALPGAEENIFVTIPLVAALTTGPNVLAVEVHQAVATSSDVSFDLELVARRLSNTATVAITINSTGLPGDFDQDGHVTAADIDLMFAALNAGGAGAIYDLDGDSDVDRGDLDRLVTQLVETTAGTGTRYGDANLDGRVDRADTLIALANLGYVGVPRWSLADFTGEGQTGLADLALLQSNLDPPASPAPSATTAAATTTTDRSAEGAQVRRPTLRTASRRAVASRAETAQAIDAALSSAELLPSPGIARRSTRRTRA